MVLDLTGHHTIHLKQLFLVIIHHVNPERWLTSAISSSESLCASLSLFAHLISIHTAAAIWEKKGSSDLSHVMRLPPFSSSARRYSQAKVTHCTRSHSQRRGGEVIRYRMKASVFTHTKTNVQYKQCMENRVLELECGYCSIGNNCRRAVCYCTGWLDRLVKV